MGSDGRGIMTTYYKVLDANGLACHGGTGSWLLPVNIDEPGAWMPAIINPQLCWCGYHVVPASSLLSWLTTNDQQVWTVDIRGAVDPSPDKVAAESARLVTRLAWDAQIARAYACDCAEHVLPIFVARHPRDRRPQEAIAVTRRYLRQEATLEELDAAGAAARAAARDAAGAAWAAAGAAAGAVAGAAWAAAWAAESMWQTERLLAYLTRQVAP